MGCSHGRGLSLSIGHPAGISDNNDELGGIRHDVHRPWSARRAVYGSPPLFTDDFGCSGRGSDRSRLNFHPGTAREAGQKGINTAILAYAIHSIINLALAYLIGGGKGEIMELFQGGLLMFIVALFLAAIPLILMGYTAGWLLYTLSGKRPPAEEPPQATGVQP
jgi:hypothetical protein